MNYKQAKTKAQLAADASGLDYAILFNGIEYDYTIAKRHKGAIFEMVYPEKETDSTYENTEPIYIEPKIKKVNVSKKG